MNNQQTTFKQILKEIYDRTHTIQNITINEVMEELTTKLSQLLQDSKQNVK